MAGGDLLDPHALNEIRQTLAIIEVSASNLVSDFLSGTYGEIRDDDGQRVQTHLQGRRKLHRRLQLWQGTAQGMHSLGVMTPPNKAQTIEWVYDPAKDHCITCRTLDGIVLTAAEWQLIPHRPQGRTLECNGFNCGCRMVPSTRPSRGIAAVDRQLRLANIPTPGLVILS